MCGAGSRQDRVILNETTDIVRRIYRGGLANITVERLVVGVFFAGVRLSNGCGGISYTPTSEIHRRHRTACPRQEATPPRLKGTPVSHVLNSADDSPLFSTVKIAVLNALSEPLISRGRYKWIDDRDALDMIEPESMGAVGMVGAFGPFLARFRETDVHDIRVIEMRKDNLSNEDKKLYVPSRHAGRVLPHCDTVIITGASIANGTIDRLLDFVRPGATVVVVGPTASFLPDALFDRHVNVVCGVRVTNPDKAIDMISEGLAAYHLFHDCMRKVSLLRPDKEQMP